MTVGLKNKLSLERKNMDTLMVETFGSEKEGKRSREVVDLLLETRAGECLQLPFL